MHAKKEGGGRARRSAAKEGSYKERRKFKMSCFGDVFRALNFSITSFASEPQVKVCPKG